MSKLYSIQESTLTNIGDALRSKYGETRPETIQVFGVVSKTPNATGPNSYEGEYGNNVNIYNVVHIPGAARIEVDLYCQTESKNYDWVQIAPGELNESTFPTDVTKYGGSTINNTQLIFDTDTITFFFRSDSSNCNYLGYYAICIGYDANGNSIELEGSTIIEKEIEVKNTYSSAEVAAAIKGLPSNVEPIVLTGNQEKVCSGALAGAYIKSFGDTISTYNLINASNMFEGFTGERIPFDINFKANSSSDIASNFFLNCKNLKELPKINNLYVYNHLQCFFSNCWSLREIPEDYFNSWVYSPSMSSFVRHNAIFYYCYSLRSMPLNWLKNLQANSANTSSYYYEGFTYCYVLDELINMPIPYTANWTSNTFPNTFACCHRLKNITFETNDDGSPKVVNWKSQTIDLTGQVGYCDTDKNRFLNYNSGITADKEVKDDATYQALKNDPDWFSTSGKYCRYNHDSAVATINSLPDTMAYLVANGGTNTIKFKGVTGSATDGGAINTLTEEEIAVAAAKGWTVSFT